jgi:hypothetical protein
MGAVSKKSSYTSTMTMKSVSRLLALFFIMCLPLYMKATKSGLVDTRNAPLIDKNVALIDRTSLTERIYNEMGLASLGLPRMAFSMAMKGFSKLRDKGMIGKDSILTIIDFSKSSKKKRLFVIDLKNEDMIF